MTNPLVVLSLVPMNALAIEAVNSPANKQFVSVGLHGASVLDIGHIRSKYGPTTLAVLGRNADIILEGKNISKEQCSFEINVETNIVMFRDRSNNRTTQVYGENNENVIPFDRLRRQVVVCSALNPCIGIGGSGCDQYLFRLQWKKNLEQTTKRGRERAGIDLQENARFAETYDDSETAMPSGMRTRVHVEGQPVRIRWISINELGSGTFGTVLKAVEVDHGKLLAVKIFKQPDTVVNRNWLWERRKREIETLAKARHPHIVEYISSQPCEEGFEIFMALEDGSLKSLVEQPSKELLMGTKDLINLVCHHILQALDYLAVKEIIHRDVKPDNILYSKKAGGYHFVLGDFGLSSPQSIAKTMVVGTKYYMAPELHRPENTTHKADVWGLYVTLLWTSGNKHFRNLYQIHLDKDDLYNTIHAIGTCENHLVDMKEMGALDHKMRASAAQMLVKNYGGKGLTTKLRRVAPIPQPDAIAHQAPGPVYQAADPCPIFHKDPPMHYPAPVRGYEAAPVGCQAPAVTYQDFPIAHQLPPGVYNEQGLIVPDTIYNLAPAPYHQGPDGYDPAPALYDPALYNPALALLDQALAFLDQAPGLYDQAPGLYDQAPGLYDQAPGLYDQAPGLYNQAPGLQDEAPAYYNQAPPHPIQPQLDSRRVAHAHPGVEQAKPPSKQS